MPAVWSCVVPFTTAVTPVVYSLTPFRGTPTPTPLQVTATLAGSGREPAGKPANDSAGVPFGKASNTASSTGVSADPGVNVSLAIRTWHSLARSARAVGPSVGKAAVKTTARFFSAWRVSLAAPPVTRLPAAGSMPSCAEVKRRVAPSTSSPCALKSEGKKPLGATRVPPPGNLGGFGE